MDLLLDRPLPKFDSPPVIETVLGFLFEPLETFTIGHLGAFWRSLGPSWTRPEDDVPLPIQVELFDKSSNWLEIVRSTVVQHSARLKVFDEHSDRMFQLQNGRLHYNWTGVRSGNEYPSYDDVKPQFIELLQAFSKFVEKENLGALQPIQWEATYVNHIKEGTLWSSPADWRSVIGPFMSAEENISLASLESFAGQWNYRVPDRKVRLHVEVRPAVDNVGEMQQILRMTLTARGEISSAPGAVETIEQGLDLGHEVIVRSFADLTTESAHEAWGRTQ